MPDVFEALVLFCFLISWYWSIAKMLRTRQASGKSAGFVRLIVVGYLLGTASKLLELKTTGELYPLDYLYIWNLIVTLVDLWLVQRLNQPARPPTSVYA